MEVHRIGWARQETFQVFMVTREGNTELLNPGSIIWVQNLISQWIHRDYDVFVHTNPVCHVFGILFSPGDYLSLY
jgi:hypothetical protein